MIKAPEPLRRLRKIRPTIAVLGPLTLSLVLFVAAAAQDTVTGAFQGDVSNTRTGEPIPGAAVSITSEQTGTVYQLVTDAQGRFWRGLLAPGFYRIVISIPGYKPRELRREIRVSVTGDVVPVPVSLEPQDPAVQPTPPALEQPDDIRVEINTTDARRDGSAKQDELTRLPLGTNSFTRSFDELAMLEPGVAPPPQTVGDVAGPGVGPGVGSSGQFSVNGLRSRANNFTVDGSDNNDEDIGVRRQGFVALIPQPVDSVQEFSIITLLSPAKFGRNLGAQVNAVSKAGSNNVNGTVYGTFNSSQLNARNFFDTEHGNGLTPVRTAAGLNVLRDGQPFSVRNQSGSEDSFTFAQGGGTFGGAIIPKRLFYFGSGEYQRINASRQKSFAVPTVEQRGPFRTGATGINADFFSGMPLPSLYPLSLRANGVFSLFPFPNDPEGIFGENTLTYSLPADGRGVILSGRLDNDFEIAGRQQRFTARYNFTDDLRSLPAVNEALFSSIKSDIQTHNLSLFLNSELNGSSADSRLFNQVRFSIGHTDLNFSEIRDRNHLVPSRELLNVPFLLNAPFLFNISQPQFNGQARFATSIPGLLGTGTVEDGIGLVGQVKMAGFSPIGVDVYNFPQDRVNRTYQLADELTWGRGGHTFVVGTDLRRTDLNSDLPRLSRTLFTFNGAPRLTPRGTGTCPVGGTGAFCFLPLSDPRAIIRPEDLAGLGAASNAILTFNVDRPDSRVDLRYYQVNFYGQDTWRIKPSLSLSFGLRYEYNTPVREVNGLIEQTFSDSRLSTAPVLRDFLAGRTSLYDPDRNNFAPRVGVAWSGALFGAGRISVLRAGYGIFHDQVLGAVANQSRNVFPTFLTFNFAGVSFGSGLLDLYNPANSNTTNNQIPLRRPGTLNQLNTSQLAAAGVTFASVVAFQTELFPNSINVTLPSQRMDIPMAHHYSAVFEQQLSNRYTLSLGYVGTTGRDLLRFTTPNLGSSLTTAPTSVGPFSFPFDRFPATQGIALIPRRPLDRTGPMGITESLGAIDQFETTARSQYHSFQTQIRGRIIDRFDVQASYTLSKATDEVSDVFDMAGAYVLPQDSFDLAAESGPANFDVRHRWTYDVIYSFPKRNTGAASWLTNGLQLATTGRYHSGQPFTVNSVVDVNLDGNLTDRLNTTTGIQITGDRRQPLRLTTNNLGALLAPFGQNGQIGRNSFRAGSVLEIDLSVIKSFALGPNRLLLRTDIFNLPNRANIGIPVRILEASGFGKATNTVTPARRVQFSVKYEF